MIDEFDEDVTVRSTADEACANLLAVLQLCAVGKVRCSAKTRRPSAATIDTVADTLVSGDFYSQHSIASFTWPLLVQAGGLAQLSGNRLEPTSRGRAVLNEPSQEAMHQLWQRWISHGVIDEMSRVDTIKGQRSANVLTAVKRRRQTVAAALATLPLGTWVPVDELFTMMRCDGYSPTVARTGRALWKLYLIAPKYGSLGYDGFHDWPILEGRYTLCVLFEYAAALGLIDLAYIDPVDARDDWGADNLDYLSRYDGLVALRCNELGASALGHTTSADAG